MATLPDRAKVVVIGAGIVGNSMAWHLARLGWRDIVLLEKGTLPSPGGSTGHASNFIFLTDHSKEMTAFTLYSVRQYEELGVAPRAPRLARDRPRREGRPPEPRRLHRSRLELHLPDRPLQGDGGVHDRERPPVPRARRLRRDRRHRGRPDAGADGGAEAADGVGDVVGRRGRAAADPGGGQGVRSVHRRVGDPRRLLHAGSGHRRFPSRPGR